MTDVLTKEDLTNLDYHAVRGEEGVKEASLKIGDMTVNVAVAHSMVLAKPLLEEIKNGTSKYHFIEIMGCPGGCIAGAGTILPIPKAKQEIEKIKKASTKQLPPKELREIELN
mgnify:CR=1 FL=1